MVTLQTNFDMIEFFCNDYIEHQLEERIKACVYDYRGSRF